MLFCLKFLEFSICDVLLKKAVIGIEVLQYYMLVEREREREREGGERDCPFFPNINEWHFEKSWFL